jgi:hypothetical protein
MRTKKFASLVAAAFLLVAFVDANADTISGSYTLYNSNGSPLQLASTGSSGGATVNLSALTGSLQGFNGFSSLQVNVALYGNGGTTQASDTYSGYSLSHDTYSSDGSVEYIYFTTNENVVNYYTSSSASVGVGSSSNSGMAPYTTSTVQTLSNYVTGSKGPAAAWYILSGNPEGFDEPYYGTSSDLCNVGDCYGVFEKNQYVTTAGYTGEYGISVPLSLFDLAGVNRTDSIPYDVTSTAGPSELLAVTMDYTYTPVPLPAAAWLLLSGLGGLGFRPRRCSGTSAAWATAAD